MRVHYWQFLVDEEGEPIPDAEIYVYLAAEIIPSFVFNSDGGGNPFKTYPVDDGGDINDIIKTNQLGFFEFWVGDQDEVNGYSQTQKFKLAWYKEGIAAGEIDYINVFVPAAEVDETDTSVAKNKMVSNFLAKKWTDHTNETILTNTPHNIETVDETDTDLVKNKVVNNYLSKGWEDHKDSIFSDEPHDIEPVDISSSNGTFNKLVSNLIMNQRPYRENITLSWSASGSLYYDDITNNSDNEYPMVQVWNTSTNMVEKMAEIQRINATTIRIIASNNFSALAILIG